MFTRKSTASSAAPEAHLQNAAVVGGAPRTARADARRWLAFTLVGAAAAGCALSPREGDGLVTDGREIHVDPTVVPDTGMPAVQGGGGSEGGGGSPEDAPPCKNVMGFVQHALPQLKTHCDECHNGTKDKATLAFALVFGDDPALQCAVVLAQGYKEPRPAKLDAPLIASSNPSRADLEHEFKFDEDQAAFDRYRDAIMLWFATE